MTKKNPECDPLKKGHLHNADRPVDHIEILGIVTVFAEQLESPSFTFYIT